jgi:phosphoglycerol transferase MdoB-like AlkP superfamily enzyme
VLKNISSVFRYFIFWYIVFAAARLAFIILNWKQTVSAGIGQAALSFYHGFRLDLSMCCYVCALPVMLWCISHFVSNKVLVNRILKTYNVLLLSVIIFVTIADGELYQHWGQKLNAYASSFAKFPKEMLVFSSGGYALKLIITVLCLIAVAYFTYSKGMRGLDEVDGTVKKWQPLTASVILIALLFLGIRGGLGKAAINQSSAFYSSNIFLNHVAINTTWNLLASFVESSEETHSNPYVFTNEKRASTLLANLSIGKKEKEPIFNTDAPDIVLVILEGWTADIVGAIGGEADVTPWFNALAREGLLFDQFYANGNRTDKGLAAIISSQPALAKSSIINNIQKFTSLPSIPAELKKKQYRTSFYYGGASEFANMKGYWISSGYDDIVDLDQFSLNKRNAEWGVHDDVLWPKILEDLNEKASPFFVTVLTLSSHEPFNVPHTSSFSGKDEADMYRNSVHFSDEALGAFFAKARQQPWYRNTVFIILADHGHQWPKDRKSFDPERFRIPFLIVGGALKTEYTGKVNHTIAGQVDIAAMLLTQLNLDDSAFHWSRNFLADTYHPYATFVYNDGIGIVKPGARLVYDQESKQRIWSEGADSLYNRMEEEARAYEQVYYEEFRRR